MLYNYFHFFSFLLKIMLDRFIELNYKYSMENNTSSINTASHAKQVGHSNTISLSPERLIALDEHLMDGGLIEELDSLTIFKLANTEYVDLQAVLGDNASKVFYFTVQYLVEQETGEYPARKDVEAFDYNAVDFDFITAQEGAEQYLAKQQQEQEEVA
jgi:hypothetical protein